MDCQAWVEYVVAQCGGELAASGSNDMARKHAAWMGTIARAKALGYLAPGAAVFIREDSGGEPAKYKADGLGNYSHVGLYAGEKALRDTDKNGKPRECCIVHSSASMGRVAGSTLGNGWTHVGLLKCVEYGIAAESGDRGGVLEGGADVPAMRDTPLPAPPAPVYAVVATPDGGAVKLRATASKREKLYWAAPNGARVRVIRLGSAWHKVSYNGRSGYVMSEFLVFGD